MSETDISPTPVEAPNSGNNGTNNHISSPHITVSLGSSDHKTIRAVLWGIAIIGLVFILTIRVAGSAADKAEHVRLDQTGFEQRINTRADQSDREFRQAAYWADQVAVACANAGMDVPPSPFVAR